MFLPSGLSERSLLDHFDEMEPKGPDCGPIAALHRGTDGYVTFHSALDPNGQPGGTMRETIAIRADELQDMFPTFRNMMTEDSFMSVHSFAAPKRIPKGQKVILSPKATLTRSDLLRYLTSVHVDLDCYKIGVTVGKAMGQIIDAANKGVVPAPSAYVESGRGLWVFWFLHDENKPHMPPRAYGANPITWKAIERNLLEKFGAAGSDGRAINQTQITRVPGSVNSKSEKAVKWYVHGEGAKPVTYTLRDLGERLKIRFNEKGYTSAQRKLPQNARGHQALYKSRHAQFEFLRQSRGGGFHEGTRHNALMVYAKLLKGMKVPDDELLSRLEELARSCHPPFPEDDAVKVGVSMLERTHLMKLKNETIADYLDITLDEHKALQDAHGDKALPPSANYRTQLETDEPAENPAKLAKQERIKARRRALFAAYERNPNATIRELSATLKRAGFDASHRTVFLDLQTLGLDTEAKTKRKRVRATRAARERAQAALI